MFIHTVKSGDTIFKIARAYSTSPMKIIENNGIENPDLLTVGEELLILTPTRTYTVRGTDTLQKIARRFGVKKNTLLANNPLLCGEDRIYPGQILAVKYDAPSFATVAANGYCFRGYDKERLLRALPYLTYLSVGCAYADSGRLGFTFDDSEVRGLGQAAGKIMMMRIYDRDGRMHESSASEEAFISLIINTAKSRGYGGITLASCGDSMRCEGYSEFLLKLRKRLLGCDLILFTELDESSPRSLCELADGCVLIYDKGRKESIPDFADAEARVYTEFANEKESAKTFIDLPAFASCSGEVMEIGEARRIARRRNLEIRHNDKTLMQEFDYTRFSAGHSKRCRVCFDSLKSTKAKLELVAELGFMGVSFDASRVEVATLMMIQAMFARQEAYLGHYDDI